MEIFFNRNNIRYGEIDQVRIVQSCNGLLLCTDSEWPRLYYVYNPSTKNYACLPPAHYYSRNDNGFFSCGDFRLAFDPRKSTHYKVVLAHRPSSGTWIHVYSSETRKWTPSNYRLSYFWFDHFYTSVYWNDAFHWLEGQNKKIEHCKLIFENNEQPIMTTIDIPNGLHRGRNFLGCFHETGVDAHLMTVHIPHLLHLQVKFFESRGSLLLASRHDIGSTDFTIYQMMRGSSVWSPRYVVNIRNFPDWSIQTHVWGICLGEREEDAFVLINLAGRVVKYYPITKTTTEVFDMKADETDDEDDDAVSDCSPYAVVPTIYEFIPSLASV